MRRILLAEPTGLCFGVERAIRAMEHRLERDGQLYCLGEPIHNPQEVARLEKRGLKVIQRPEQAPPGALVFIRAHGVAPAVIDRLRDRGNRVCDGSCPFVQAAQKRARELESEGRFVIIAGDASHPEVQAITGSLTREPLVVGDSTELVGLGKLHKIGLLSQTTLPEERFASIAASLVLYTADLRVCKTICAATVDRQAAVRALARKCDGLVLIGGRNSANTSKLYSIASQEGCDVQWIEQADQIDLNWLADKHILGIAAGASTPDWLIKQFITVAKEAAER